MLLLLACALSSQPTAPPPASTPPATAAPAPAPAPVPPAPARVVAVGDLHGDLDAARAALQLAGVLDDKGHWSGGETWLVQTGDITDRGPDSRGVIALLRQLTTEAEAAGGKVIPLLGNHEVMNVLGDLRYVSPEDTTGYGGEAARKQAFSATGEDGAWLRARDASAQVGRTVFVHGGIDPRWAAEGIERINLMVRDVMQRGQPGLVYGNDGPLWNRVYALGDEATACPMLQEALSSLSATRMVVGHTTQEDGKIHSRCDDRLWLIDTGISAHYGRHLSALEIKGDTVTPLYPLTAAP